MAAAQALGVALALVVWALAVLSLFYTEQAQRWHIRLFRRFPLLWWPLPPALLEGYFRSRYFYYQTKFAGLVALLGATIAALVLLSKLFVAMR